MDKKKKFAPAKPEVPQVDQEIQMLREAIRQVFELACGCDDLKAAANALQAISQGTGRLSQLIKTQSELGSQTSEVETALQIALAQVLEEMRHDEKNAEQLSFPFFPARPGSQPVQGRDDQPD